MKTSIVPPLFALLLSIILFGSCTTISYVPKVNLDVSARTIKKTVMVEKLENFTPESDQQNPYGGFSVTNEKALSGNLNVEVTNAIVSDFATNGVFSNVSRRVENPDYILRGEIRKFMGKSKMSGYAIFGLATYGAGAVVSLVTKNTNIVAIGSIPIFTQFFGVPIRNNISEIEIELKLYDNAGNLIGNYVGKSTEKMPINMYNNGSLSLPSQTNRVFSQAMSQIRQQLLNDPKLGN